MENCALWHERDISHSSVERVIAPDANILADYMLWRLKELLARLEVFPERMRENLEKLQGVVFSQQVLLALVEAGLSRDEAYQAVQRNALAALDRNVPFRTLLEEDHDVQRALKGGDLAAVFDSRKYLKHTDYLFRKVLGS
jgi:adenylosuccinate lyase